MTIATLTEPRVDTTHAVLVLPAGGDPAAMASRRLAELGQAPERLTLVIEAGDDLQSLDRSCRRLAIGLDAELDAVRLVVVRGDVDLTAQAIASRDSAVLLD